MKEVSIGTQIWMAENLNVDKFRNGDLIPNAKTDEEWEKAGKNGRPAWCYFNNSGLKGEKYGKLYNWYAVNDPRGLAPKGWHVPNSNEWNLLAEYCDASEAATILKSTSGWNDNKNGTDEVGFSALPGGTRGSFGDFYPGGWAYFWSSTEFSPKDASYLLLTGSFEVDWDLKGKGYYVRCLKD